MQRIPLSLAEPDMILELPVTRPDKPEGLAIFGKGIKLTESSIERLKNMGVQAITIEGHPLKVEGEESLDDILCTMEERFRKVKDNPEMMQLLDLFKDQIKQDYGR